MPPRARWPLALAAAAALAGCSATGTASLAAKGGPSPAPTPSASPSTTPGSAAPTPGPASAPSCTASQLSVSTPTDENYPSGTLKHITELRLTNTSQATCQLQGWPTSVGITRGGVSIVGVLARASAYMSNPDHPASTASVPPVITLPPGGDALELIEVGDYTASYPGCAGMRHADTTVTLGLPDGGGTLVVSSLSVFQCLGNTVFYTPFVHDHHGYPPNAYVTPPQSASPGPSGPPSPGPSPS